MTRLRSHTKYFNAAGERVPNVTTVIGTNLGWKWPALMAWQKKTLARGLDPDAVRDDAGHAGTLAHLLVQEHIQGSLLGKSLVDYDFSEYSGSQIDRAEGAFLGFLEWGTGHEVKYVASELQIVSERLQVGGTLDLVAVVDGVLSLVDFKTSRSIYTDHRIQIAAYRELYREAYEDELTPYILLLDAEKGNCIPFGPDHLGDLKNELQVFELVRQLDSLKDAVA